VQIALKPASKTLGLHAVVIRCKGLKYVIADSAFKRMQVDARACWLDTDNRGVSLRCGPTFVQARQARHHRWPAFIAANTRHALRGGAAAHPWSDRASRRRTSRQSRSAKIRLSVGMVDMGYATSFQYP
jgi:hypothetical protein